MTTFICPDCGRQITRGGSGTEYGHSRGVGVRGGRCPRRPDCVDPRRGDVQRSGKESEA